MSVFHSTTVTPGLQRSLSLSNSRNGAGGRPSTASNSKSTHSSTSRPQSAVQAKQRMALLKTVSALSFAGTPSAGEPSPSGNVAKGSRPASAMISRLPLSAATGDSVKLHQIPSARGSGSGQSSSARTSSTAVASSSSSVASTNSNQSASSAGNSANQAKLDLAPYTQDQFDALKDEVLRLASVVDDAESPNVSSVLRRFHLSNDTTQSLTAQVAINRLLSYWSTKVHAKAIKDSMYSTEGNSSKRATAWAEKSGQACSLEALLDHTRILKGHLVKAVKEREMVDGALELHRQENTRLSEEGALLRRALREAGGSGSVDFSKLNNNSKELDLLKSQLSDAQQALKKSGADCFMLKNEIDAMRSELSAHRKRAEIAIQERDEAIAQSVLTSARGHNTSSSKLQALEAKLSSALADKEHAEKAKVASDSQLESMKRQFREIETEAKALREESAKYSRQLAKEQSSVRTLTEELAEIRRQLNQVKTDEAASSSRASDLERLMRELASAEGKIKGLQLTLSNKDKEVSDALSERDELSARVGSLETEIEALKSRSDSMIRTLQARIAELESLLNSSKSSDDALAMAKAQLLDEQAAAQQLQQKLLEAQNALQNRDRVVADLQRQLEQLTAEVHSMQSSSSGAMSDLRAELADSKKLQAGLRQKVDDADGRVLELQALLRKSQSELAQAQAEIQRAKSGASDDAEAASRYRTKYEDLSREFSEMKSKLVELKSSEATAKEGHKAALHRLSEADEKSSRLVNEVASLKQRLSETNSVESTWKKKVAALQRTLAELELRCREHESRQAELRSMEKSIKTKVAATFEQRFKELEGSMNGQAKSSAGHDIRARPGTAAPAGSTRRRR